MTLLINILGLLLMGLIIGWFWLMKPKAVSANTQHTIEIRLKDGVYQPAIIQATINQPIILRFIREDASPCAETVIFPSLNLSKTLPLHTPIDVQLILQQAGDYEFTCQMAMYRGIIAVKNN